jgi:hypothetical protein
MRCAVSRPSGWAFVWFLIIQGFAGFAWGQPETALDADTETALRLLGNLTPQGQSAVLAGIESSSRDKELGQRQVPLLAGLVEEPAWTTAHRRRVAFLLALQGESSQGALERLASQDNPAVREAARDALELHGVLARSRSAVIKEREAAISDLAAIAEKHPESAAAVIIALAAAYTRQEEQRYDIRGAALRALLRFGDRAAPALVESFENRDPYFYQHTKAALLSIREHARPALLAGLEHRDPYVRQRVIYTLLEAGMDDEAASAMTPLQSDRSELVRDAAREAIGFYRARVNQTGRAEGP